jgi:hypothetical protein
VPVSPPLKCSRRSAPGGDGLLERLELCLEAPRRERYKRYVEPVLVPRGFGSAGPTPDNPFRCDVSWLPLPITAVGTITVEPTTSVHAKVGWRV